jgi:Flp pilus assembly protein TadB
MKHGVASASAPLQAAPLPVQSLPQRMRSAALETLQAMREHPIAKFLSGLLLLLAARRIATRWSMYAEEPELRRRSRNWDMVLSCAAGAILAGDAFVPWPRLQALVAIIAAVGLYVPVWRLFENAEGRRAKIGAGLPYAVGTFMAAMGAGSAILAAIAHWFQFITDYH